MADPFSLAAGSFAVVGVVDVVLRASIECCQFLSAIQGAPEEISKLKTCIEQSGALVEAFITHLNGLQNIAMGSVISRMEKSLKLFEKAVKNFNRDLTALRILEVRYKGSSKLWSAVRHILDEKKLNKCLGRLDNAKSMLSAALLLVEGVRSAARQEAIETAVKQSSSQMTMTSKRLQQDVTSIKQNQDAGVRIQKKIITQSAQQARVTRLVRREVRDSAHFNKNQHAKTRAKVAEGNQRIIDTITSRLSNLEVKQPKLIRTNREYREYRCIGDSGEMVFDLLGYIKAPFQRAVVLAIAQSVDVGWVQEEFATLLQSAAQENAALCPRTTATSVDHWTYSTIPHRNRTIYECRLPSKVDEEKTTISNFKSTNMTPMNRKLLHSKVVSHVSCIGELRLNVLNPLDKEDSIGVCREARVMFIPAVGFWTTSLGIQFVHRLTHGMEPKFYTQLNALRLIESIKMHWHIIAYGTLEKIDLAFRSGSMSPYDQLREGRMICFRLAGVHFRSDFLRYLKCQGFSMSSVNGEDDVLIGAWASLQSTELDARSETSLKEILQIIAETSIDDLSAANDALLHTTCRVAIREVTERRYRMIRTILTFLDERGYDLNMPDTHGRSPLLTHISARGGAGLAIAKTLLDLGADPHSVDRYGNNAIQLAMSSNVAWNRGDVGPMVRGLREFPEILLGKLELLVKAGVSLAHENHRGETVFSVAKQYNCLDAFRKALELSGKPWECFIKDAVTQQ